MNRVKQNFLYPKIKPEHYRLGAANMGPVIRENGNWSDFLPADEKQRRGVETSACYIYGQTHAIATMQEALFKMKDMDYSERFNALLSDGTEYGGDPLVGADSIRRDGLVPESMMPLTDEVTSWSDYHSFKGVNENVCRTAGQLFKKRWKLNNYIVFERDESVEEKYKKLKEALKRGLVAISVDGWGTDGNGIYIKQKGARDNHMVECFYVDELNRPHFFDTYEPFIKIGEPFYNSDFCLRWSVAKIEESKTDGFWELLKKFFSFLK